MEVELIAVEGCPNVELARERIAEASARSGIRVTVRERLVSHVTPDIGAVGSPTVLVAGEDVSPPPDSAGGVSCRRYPSPSGIDGAPSVEVIADALRRVHMEGCDGDEG